MPEVKSIQTGFESVFNPILVPEKGLHMFFTGTGKRYELVYRFFMVSEAAQ